MEKTEMTEGTSPPVAGDGKGQKGYVAVVFFHGIGQQRNSESTAQLVEAIDDWVFTRWRTKDAGFEIPRLEIKFRREQLGDRKEGEEILCIQADYSGKRVRYYEGYWAPATVMGATAGGAFIWLMRQIARPIRGLIAPWRAYPRLRRADLIRLDQRIAREEAINATERDRISKDTGSLIRLYEAFVRRREPERGRFRNFIKFIEKDFRVKEKSQETEERLREHHARRQRVLDLARRWRRLYVKGELSRAGVLLGVGMTVIAGLVLLFSASLYLLSVLTGWISYVPALDNLGISEIFKPEWKNVVAVAAFFIAAFGVSRFMRDFVGDVQQFVTYEEAEPLFERRKKVLSMAEKTLRHVLSDQKCERVVIVAHSLGTAVALDAILRLRSANQASNPEASEDQFMKGPLPLNKIQHFVTCGSPIDKINYFFASFRSASRNYEKLIDQMRGDIGSAPFSKSGRQPHIHWVNFWDLGDPISGPLETVAASIIRDQHVDNVQVASYVWPDPPASHTGYFQHRETIRVIYGAAFQNECSFASPPRDSNKRPIWNWIGPGKGSVFQLALLLMLPLTSLLLIWTSIALWIPRLGSAPIRWLGGVVVALIAGAVAQRRLKLHLAPIRTEERIRNKRK